MAYSRLKDLRQRKADLVHAMDGMLAEAQHGVTELDQRAYDSRKKELEEVSAALAQEEVLLEQDRDAARRRSEERAAQQQGGMPGASGDVRQDRAHLQRSPGPEGRRYTQLFGDAGDLGGFADAEEFLRVVASGLADPRILQLNAATGLEGIPSSGGFVVPGALAATWLDASLESEIVRPRCDVRAMTTSELRVAGFDVSDLSGSAPFGFKSEWSDENLDTAAQAGKFRMIRLTAKKLKLYSEASSELVQDGLSFEAQLGQAMVQACGWSIDDACLTGDGNNKPLGVLSDPALCVVAKEPAQPNATISYTNIVTMFSRLHPSCMKDAVWVANSTTLPQMLTLSVGIGAAGVLMPAVRESDGNFTLLGMPLLFTEKLPTLGQQGDVVLASFSNYALGLRRDLILETSNALGWGRDVMSYRVCARLDGQGKWNKAQTPKNGLSRSWCVTLAARP